MSTSWRTRCLFAALAFLLAACELPLEEGTPPGPELASSSAALTQSDTCVENDPACTPTGAHGKHAVYDCRVCHAVGGRLSFQRTGPAYGMAAAPAFDATAKTCANVACHGVKPGTFSYYFLGGDGEPELRTVNYGGTGQTTPSWYATGASCAACHGNPPRNGSDGSNIWHSGYHGNQGPTGTLNQCQLCHSDATSVNGVATGLNPLNAALHANGAVNVTATFRSSCFGCH